MGPPQSVSIDWLESLREFLLELERTEPRGSYRRQGILEWRIEADRRIEAMR